MWLTTLPFLLTLLSPSWAEDANSIMKSIEKKQQWTVATQTLSLTIQKGPSNKGKQYTMQTQMRRESDAIYCHARFTKPKSVGNTQIVWIDRTVGTDDMWLYLPALKRVTTLNDKNQSRAFMGSDFEFNDFLLMSLSQEHALLENTSTTWVIKSTPTNSDQTPYTSWISSIDKQTLAPLEIQFFINENNVKDLKILEVNPEGIPTKSRMTNLETGSTTLLEIHSIDTQSAIPLSYFTKEHLISGSSTLEP